MLRTEPERERGELSDDNRSNTHLAFLAGSQVDHDDDAMIPAPMMPVRFACHSELVSNGALLWHPPKSNTGNSIPGTCRTENAVSCIGFGGVLIVCACFLPPPRFPAWIWGPGSSV
eukprot:1811586-Rhodomonas_salina.2